MSSTQNLETAAVDLRKQAEIHLAQGRFTEAVSACEAALKIHPNWAIVRVILGKALQSQGNLGGAKEQYKTALSQESNLAEAHANLGSLYAQEKHWQEAITAYQKAITLAPQWAAAYRSLATLWSQLDKPKEASECWYQALTIDPKWATAEEHLTLGNTLLEQGKLEESITCYHRALQANPNLAAAYHNLGEILTNQKKLEEALTYHEKAVELSLNSFEFYHGLGKNLAAQGKFDRAISSYKKAIEIHPNFVRGYYHLGLALYQQGKREEATSCYQKSLELNPFFFWSYNALGELLAKQGQWEEALNYYQKAIELKPDVPWFYSNLGVALTIQKSWDRAAAAYSRAIQLQPETPGIYGRLGYVLRKRSEADLEATIQAYCHALAVEPETQKADHEILNIQSSGIDFYANAASNLAKHSQFDAAIIFYRIALQLQPDSQLTLQLEEAIKNKEKLSAQIRLYRQNIEEEPTSATAYNELGNLLPKLGELEEAIACHQKAAALRGWPECGEKNYQFTQDWFTHNIPIWQRYLEALINIPDLNVLEIGSFQGMSTCWLLDRILTHKTAKITCIDLYFQEQFDGNIAKTGVSEKVIKLQGLSQDWLRTLAAKAYEVAYIDGCHKATSVLQDALLSWPLVKVGGLIIFDDYEFTFPDHPELNPQPGIKTFLDLYQNQLEVIHVGYQLIAKKTADLGQPEEKILFAQAFQKLGEAVAEAGHLEEAKLHYQKSLEYQPNQAIAYHKLGKVLLEQHQFEEAITAFQKAIELNSNFCWSYHFLGEALQGLGKLNEAVTAYQKATELNPDFCWTYNSLGEIFMQQSRWEEAVAAFDRATELKQDSCWLYNNLGTALVKLSQWPEAEIAFRQAIALDLNFCWFYHSLGEVLEKQDRWPEATEIYRQAVTLNPAESWLYKKLADSLRLQGLLDEAIKTYQKGIELDPDSHLWDEGLGTVMLQKQQWEAAITYLIKALLRKPDLIDIYPQLGYALEQQGELDREELHCCQYQMLPLSVIRKYTAFNDESAISSELHPQIHRVEVYPATQISLSPTKTIDGQPLFSESSYDFSQAFVAEWPGGRAWADVLTSASITSDHKLVSDLSTGCAELVIASDKIAASSVEELDETVAFLSVRWAGTAYYHWMFDVLPRIHLLRQSGLYETIDKFVINGVERPYEFETLKILGIPQDKLIESRNRLHFKAKKLVVPSICYQGTSQITQWGCDFLKKEFLTAQTLQTTETSRRIYISRQQAAYRKVLNEEAVVNFLEQLGFECVKLEAMSVVEQAACLANAEIVVAPHGAGLTNLVFCRPGTKVIEIFPPTYLPCCYWILSNICSLEHYSLRGESVEEDPALSPVHRDILVNLSALEKMLNFAGFLHES